MILETIIGLSAACMIFCAFMLWRNERVCKERMRLISVISDLNHADIAAGQDPMWRYDILKSISYEHMLYTFWKPVGSFYPPVEEWQPPWVSRVQ